MRRARGQPARETDRLFIAALAAGLPACSGVALGFDRVVMVAAGARSIDDVIAFPIERA
jgi:lysyl-tRNA synthetase class 2